MAQVIEDVAADELLSPEEEVAEMTKTQEIVKEKILHILKVYPGISETMLQMGIGPAVKPDVWRPLLEVMIHDGEVQRRTLHLKAPSNRHNRYTKLELTRELTNDEIDELHGE